jgi:hypothetical protein
MLSMSPSVQNKQSWVLAADAVLDAATLAASSMDTFDSESARICVKTGSRAFMSIANALGRTCQVTRQTTECTSREWYEAARAHLYSMGLRSRSAGDADSQWHDFWSLRTQYEGALLFVASQTFATLESTPMVAREKGDRYGKESS